MRPFCSVCTVRSQETRSFLTNFCRRFQHARTRRHRDSRRSHLHAMPLPAHHQEQVPRAAGPSRAQALQRTGTLLKCARGADLITIFAIIVDVGFQDTAQPLCQKDFETLTLIHVVESCSSCYENIAKMTLCLRGRFFFY